MKRLIPLLLLLALVAMLLPPAATAQDPNRTTPRKPLPYIVPEGTLFFASLPDVQKSRKQIENWEFNRLINLPEMKAFLKPMMDQIEEQRAEMDAQLKDRIGMDTDAVLDLFAGQISIALIDVNTDGMLRGEDGEMVPPNPGQAQEALQSAKVLVVIDVDRTTETFGNAFSYFQKELAKDSTFEVINHMGVEITKVKANRGGDERREDGGEGEGDGDEDGDNDPDPFAAPPAPAGPEEFFYCLFNQSLLFSLDLGTIKQSLDLYRSPLPDGSLGRALKFRKVRQNLVKSNEMAFCYGDLEAVINKIRANMPEDQLENFDKGIDISGIGGLKAIGANIVMDGSVLRDNVFLYAPGTRKGIVQVMSLPPTQFTTLKWVPANALSYSSMNFDGELLWIEILEAIRAGSPETYLEVQDALERRKEEGFDITNGLFGALGGEVASWAWVDDAGKQHSTIHVGLKDSQAFDKFLTAVMDMVIKDSDGQAPLSLSQVAGKKVWIVDLKSQREELENQGGPQGMPQGAPPFVMEALLGFQSRAMPDQYVIGIANDAVLMTTSEDDFAFLVNNPQGLEKSLAHNETFQKARKQGFDQPSLFQWMDTPRVMEMYHGIGKEIVEGFREEQKTNPESTEGVPLDFNHFPDADAVKGVFSPGAVVEARNNVDGLLLRSRGVGLAVVAGVVAGVVGYSVQSERIGEMPPGGPMPVDPQGEDEEKDPFGEDQGEDN